MFDFIHAWSGQSGSGFVPHSPAPVGFAPPPPPPPSLPVAAAVAEPDVAGAADADAAAEALALALGAALADAVADADIDGTPKTAEAVALGWFSAVLSFGVQAAKRAAMEQATRTRDERMAGELTRKRV